MSVFFEKFLSSQQCGFRNEYSTQHCLLHLLEKWKNCVDKGKVFESSLTDLSKAFHCLDHELLIAKLNAYGFNLPALPLIHDYLSNRKQRTKMMIIIVPGQKYFLASHKDQFLVHYCSIFLWRISSS